ncbi:hypothetical protein LAZ40_16215 [Cereibacter sphaeroides]|uniref:hypothetical protein n=1 Tax=Cereibacter sphaeroides TaxID=1063 RepID=UPI001F406E4C|nr:hypothetical protein [Cereibacter sphaeroides]MCE6960570.1 hypothetical protein [Cereibacter sphaeroides]MCE6972749.1 hypothetical protein [Cereibacter sphaeroides]
MSTDQERLVVLLEARIRDFEKNMQKAETRGTRSYGRLRRDSRSATQAMEQDMVRSTGRINEALASTSSRIGAFGGAFLKGLGAGLVAGAVAEITVNVGQTVRAVAQLGDEAKRAGLSAQAFQEWKFVAEQNRIGVDSLVDGFKELSLRADEFIVTGAGPAAEAFQRLGFDAAALREGLKDPSELMLEIIGRMQDLDRAAQIRVADEIFGGTGGERFVELLSQGENGLRKTIARAHEAGAVLDKEMIEKAAELDRKFQELTTRAGNFFKTVIVGAADVAAEAADLRANLDQIFPDQAQAEAILGPGVKAALDADRNAVDQHAEQLGILRQQYETLADQARALIPALQQTAATLEAWGYSGASDELGAAAEEMARLSDGIRDGTISAGDFETGLAGVTSRAEAAMTALDDVDRSTFSNVIAGLGGLGRALAAAVGLAQALRAEMPGGVGAADDERGGNTGNIANAWTGTRNAPKTSPRPQRPGVDSFGNFIDAGTPAAGGGGGKAERSEYDGQVISTREATEALQAEAAALNAAELAMTGYADVAEYAKQRMELLVAAQKDGREITPELAAEIDQLAQDYVTAGHAADQARERHEAFESALATSKATLESAFTGLITGAHSFGDALSMVASRLAEMALSRAFDGLWSAGLGSAVGSALGGLGFSSGGYTGPGGLNEPAGIVHKGEVVFSQADVARAGGVAAVEAMRRGSRGYAPGGGGGGSPQGRRDEVHVEVSLSPDLEGRILKKAETRATEITGAGMREVDKGIRTRIQQYERNPRRQW